MLCFFFFAPGSVHVKYAKFCTIYGIMYAATFEFDRLRAASLPEVQGELMLTACFTTIIHFPHYKNRKLLFPLVAWFLNYLYSCECVLYDQQLLLYTMSNMASHQVIVTWHKIAVSEGMSQGYVRLGISESSRIKVWQRCQHTLALGSICQQLHQALTSSCSV